MASKLTEEPRKLGEFLFIVGFAALVLALGVVATRGLPGGNDNGMSGVGSDPLSSPTAASPYIPSPTSANPSPTVDSDATRDPRDTWVPAEQFPGVEAIHPSLDTAVPGEPRVTVSDVEAYVADDPSANEIVSIEFLPAEVVEERHNAGPGAYGGRLLCVVDLRGSFNIGLPPEVQEKIREDGRTFEITRSIRIFDAFTGNLLTSSYPPP